MYMGDCSAYSPRSGAYRDYEKFPYGSLERVSNPQKSYYAMVQGKQTLQKKNTQTQHTPNWRFGLLCFKYMYILYVHISSATRFLCFFSDSDFFPRIKDD